MSRQTNYTLSGWAFVSGICAVACALIIPKIEGGDYRQAFVAITTFFTVVTIVLMSITFILWVWHNGRKTGLTHAEKILIVPAEDMSERQ